jgi:hypothetical protein
MAFAGFDLQHPLRLLEYLVKTSDYWNSPAGFSELGPSLRSLGLPDLTLLPQDTLTTTVRPSKSILFPLNLLRVLRSY